MATSALLKSSPGGRSAEQFYFDALARALTGIIYPQSADYLIQPCRRPGLKNRLKSFIASALLAKGFKLYKTNVFAEDKRQAGEDWPSIGFTMVGLARLHNVVELTSSVIARNVPGDLVECGVWRGGASMMMKAALKYYDSPRRLWLADSFEGLPSPTAVEDQGHDLSGLPYLCVSEAEVRDNFRRLDLLDDRVHFLKGWFSDTLPASPIGPIAVLRADADLYESTRDILTNLYPKVSEGGYVIIDDYFAWEPCRRAVDEYRATFDITADLVAIDSTAVYWRV